MFDSKNTKEIRLTQGKVAVVSEHRFDYLNQWKWCARQDKKSGLWYAERRVGKWPHQKCISMHRVVANASPGELVDHKDRNGLHNWDENLRIATPTNNSQNRKKNERNKSGYKGVRKLKPYRAVITINGKHTSLGHFDTAEEAAHAYDRAAKQYFGEFAVLNFPED